MKVNLKNDVNMIKTLPIGYNFLIAICGPALTLTYVSLKLGLLMAIIPGSQLIVAYYYNRKQIEKTLMNGFKPADEQSKNTLQQYGIIANENGVVSKTNKKFTVKKILLSLVALLVIIGQINSNSVPNIDLTTTEATIDIDKLNNTLFNGTDLQKDEIKKESKNKVLETYIYVDDIEKYSEDCIRIKSTDQINYIPTFKTYSVVCTDEKISKDKLLSITRGKALRIKGVVRDFNRYADVNSNFKIVDRYIVNLKPAIITKIIE